MLAIIVEEILVLGRHIPLVEKENHTCTGVIFELSELVEPLGKQGGLS